jgi:CubicO group peptidase (beta-lactamase class C family)
MTARRDSRAFCGLRFLFLLLSAPLSAARAADFPVDELDAFIKQSLKEYGVPGCAVAVVQDDKIVLVRGYGVRRSGADDPVDEHTLFMIASNTKPFTAALLATLVDEGKLGWDDHVIERLPEFVLPDPYPTREATIRDLLAHRTGLPAFTGDNLERLGFDRPEILRRIRFFKPTHSFREKAGYSNPGYLAAGMVAARVGHASWEDLIKSRLLQPLGMTHSGVSGKDREHSNNVAEAHFARPTGELYVVPWNNHDPMGPAGSITSTAADMAQWVRMQLNDGRLDGKQIISANSIQEMHTPAMVETPTFAELAPIDQQSGFSYGLGWGIFHYQGSEILEKGGAQAGMRSVVTLVPGKKAGIIVLANMNLTVLPEAIRAKFLELVVAPAGRDLQAEIRQAQAAIKKSFSTAPPAKAKGGPASLPLAKYAGVYTNDLCGPMTIRLVNGALRWEAGPEHFGGPLEHVGYDTFSLGYPPGQLALPDEVTFVLDAAGHSRTLITESYGTLQRAKP